MTRNKKAVEPEEEVTEEKAGKILDTLYDKALVGVPTVSRSVDEMVADYCEKHASVEDAAKALARNQVLKCGTSGFITGLGGAITLPVTLPANIASVLYVQLRMVAAIAKMGGYDTKSDQVQTLVYMCLSGTAITDVLKDAGVQIGQKALIAAIKKIPGEVLVKINQKIGFRLITKFGEKGVINLGKAVPIVGGFIGGGFDVATTSLIANNAIRMFISGEDSIEGILAGEDVLEAEAVECDGEEEKGDLI